MIRHEETRIEITSRTRHRVEAVATIPMPEARYYTVARAQAGARVWTVMDYGDAVVVTDALDPSAQPLRASKLRDRIVAAARPHWNSL